MMRLRIFAVRTAKEILRDPLNLAFGLGFPLVLLAMMSAIQNNIPVELFRAERLTPGIAVFGLSFMTLFSATLLAKDRSGALLQRLYATPLTSVEYILGYMLPMLPIALLQTIICYGAALLLGLKMSFSVLTAVAVNVPMALFFIALGLLCGSLFHEKQVGGICGALLTNLTAWLSGSWFDLELLGGGFCKAAQMLPFVHGVELGRAVLSGDSGAAGRHALWVIGYAAAFLVLAVIVFMKRREAY